MSIRKFSEDLLIQIKQQSEKTQDKKAIEQATKMINVIQECIFDLQQYVYNYTFIDTLEEIWFFKEMKPVILSQYFYYKQLRDLYLYNSFKDPESQRTYLLGILRKLEKEAHRHYSFYMYCISGQSENDESYFTRKHRTAAICIDSRFSTVFDETLARLLAGEMLRKKIKEEISQLDRRPYSDLGIKWTGNKTDAIELLIALHASGNLNDGQAEVKQLIRSFEELFQFKLDNYYDLLKRIRMRKGGRTNFLDFLKERFLNKLDQMDG